MEQSVLIEEFDSTLVITLNNPRTRNALNGKMARIVADALDELDARDDLRVAIVTGDAKAFSSGMDFKAFAEGDRPSVPGRGLMGFAERTPNKPVLAAVEGWALGAGFELALACDLIVAAETSVFGLPEAKRGLIAAGGGLVRLAQRIPYPVVMDLAITGRQMSAAEAHSLGLVARVTPQGGALAAARDLALDICASAPKSVRISKQLIRAAQSWPMSEGFSGQAEFIQQLEGSPDIEEGTRAFLEKRTPVWKDV